MAKQEKKKQKSATALCGAYHVILIFFFPFPQTRKNESWMQVILFPNFYYYFLVITRENAQIRKKRRLRCLLILYDNSLWKKELFLNPTLCWTLSPSDVLFSWSTPDRLQMDYWQAHNSVLSKRMCSIDTIPFLGSYPFLQTGSFWLFRIQWSFTAVCMVEIRFDDVDKEQIKSTHRILAYNLKKEALYFQQH